jgi:arsenate reductase
MKKIIFVCTHNSGRSQMAEAFARRMGQGRLAAFSAGTEPGADLNPVVAEAMAEIGYDLAGHYTKPLTPDIVEGADRIITMGCGVNASTCPASYLVTDDWGLDDPADQPIEKVRMIRDFIYAKVEALLMELGE